eukprot:TRINITY_DN2504_c0_g4_i1.p1 TRINITY_DN2504_c0_g4~~TRINITY_DN2504_c0_g4_i1.p1  ORF type:complete len:930 (+),score=333.78 TRINITY_DN2504_c0_g4_i1:102-2792(+)
MPHTPPRRAAAAAGGRATPPPAHGPMPPPQRPRPSLSPPPVAGRASGSWKRPSGGAPSPGAHAHDDCVSVDQHKPRWSTGMVPDRRPTVLKKRCPCLKHKERLRELDAVRKRRRARVAAKQAAAAARGFAAAERRLLLLRARRPSAPAEWEARAHEQHCRAVAAREEAAAFARRLQQQQQQQAPGAPPPPGAGELKRRYDAVVARAKELAAGLPYLQDDSDGEDCGDDSLGHKRRRAPYAVARSTEARRTMAACNTARERYQALSDEIDRLRSQMGIPDRDATLARLEQRRAAERAALDEAEESHRAQGRGSPARLPGPSSEEVAVATARLLLPQDCKGPVSIRETRVAVEQALGAPLWQTAQRRAVGDAVRSMVCGAPGEEEGEAETALAALQSQDADDAEAKEEEADAALELKLQQETAAWAGHCADHGADDGDAQVLTPEDVQRNLAAVAASTPHGQLKHRKQYSIELEGMREGCVQALSQEEAVVRGHLRQMEQQGRADAWGATALRQQNERAAVEEAAAEARRAFAANATAVCEDIHRRIRSEGDEIRAVLARLAAERQAAEDGEQAGRQAVEREQLAVWGGRVDRVKFCTAEQQRRGALCVEQLAQRMALYEQYAEVIVTAGAAVWRVEAPARAALWREFTFNKERAGIDEAARRSRDALAAEGLSQLRAIHEKQAAEYREINADVDRWEELREQYNEHFSRIGFGSARCPYEVERPAELVRTVHYALPLLEHANMCQQSWIDEYRQKSTELRDQKHRAEVDRKNADAKHRRLQEQNAALVEENRLLRGKQAQAVNALHENAACSQRLAQHQRERATHLQTSSKLLETRNKLQAKEIEELKAKLTKALGRSRSAVPAAAAAAAPPARGRPTVSAAGPGPRASSAAAAPGR